MSAQVPASGRRSPEEGLVPRPADFAVPTDALETSATSPAPAAAVPSPAPERPSRAHRSRRRLAVAGVVVLVGAGGAALAAGLPGGDAPARPAAATARADVEPPVEDGVVSTETARQEGGATAERRAGQVDPLAPLPKARPKVVAPVAGRASGEEDAAAGAGAARSNAEEQMALPKPTGPASQSSAGAPDPGGVRNLSADTATALPNGVALPPLEAPEAVMQVIRAGNTIARTPYKWGGGHGNFQDSGYDCSGSVTFALYSAGLIGGSATSGQLMSYGKPGPGRWITLYTNPGHVFMVVAGIRFDTVGRARTGSRWQNEMVSTSGYVARHPPGY